MSAGLPYARRSGGRATNWRQAIIEAKRFSGALYPSSERRLPEPSLTTRPETYENPKRLLPCRRSVVLSESALEDITQPKGEYPIRLSIAVAQCNFD